MKKWSEEEITFLMNNPRMPVKEQARILGRTKSSVKSARERFCVSPKIPVPERYSQHEKILRLHSLMAQYNLKLKGE